MHARPGTAINLDSKGTKELFCSMKTPQPPNPSLARFRRHLSPIFSSSLTMLSTLLGRGTHIRKEEFTFSNTPAKLKHVSTYSMAWFSMLMRMECGAMEVVRDKTVVLRRELQ
jgi:hypothetical protein